MRENAKMPPLGHLPVISVTRKSPRGRDIFNRHVYFCIMDEKAERDANDFIGNGFADKRDAALERPGDKLDGAAYFYPFWNDVPAIFGQFRQVKLAARLSRLQIVDYRSRYGSRRTGP